MNPYRGHEPEEGYLSAIVSRSALISNEMNSTHHSFQKRLVIRESFEILDGLNAGHTEEAKEPTIRAQYTTDATQRHLPCDDHAPYEGYFSS